MSEITKMFTYVNDEHVDGFKSTYINYTVENFGESTKYDDKLVFLGSSGQFATQGNLYGHEVVDNLESTDTNKTLSANQGYVLNGKIGNLNTITDELTNKLKIQSIWNETAKTADLSYDYGDYGWQIYVSNHGGEYITDINYYNSWDSSDEVTSSVTSRKLTIEIVKSQFNYGDSEITKSYFVDSGQMGPEILYSTTFDVFEHENGEWLTFTPDTPIKIDNSNYVAYGETYQYGIWVVIRTDSNDGVLDKTLSINTNITGAQTWRGHTSKVTDNITTQCPAIYINTYGIGMDAYPKSETYTQSEINTLLDNKADKIKLTSESATTLEISPNHFYQWGEVTELNISLAEPEDTTIYNEYMFQFTSGDTATTLSLPDTLTWYLGINTILPNKTYQISIVNNLAVLAEF